MEEIVSEGLRLQAHLSRPPGVQRVPGLVLLAGFPRGAGGAAMAGQTYPPLAERLTREAGWAALTFAYRGTSTSEGDFSIDGWLADTRAAVDVLADRPDVSSIWLVGFRLGGTIAIVTAAGDDRVRGLATFSAPASLRAWVRDPGWFLEYARRGGVLRTEGYPQDPVAWTRAIANLDPLEAASRIGPRPWLVVHGSDDDVVPVDDARALAAARRPGAELRIVQNGAHRLRHDPRAIAMLLGWLDRREL